MAESKAEQIVAAIVTRLEGIAEDNGVTYWLTPDRVLRAPGFTRDCLDSSLATIYTAVPVDDQVIEHTSGEVQRELVLAIALATKYTPSSESPLNPPDPDRWKLQNRMVQDVLKRLLDDSTVPFNWFGAIGVENLEVLLIDMTAENTYEIGWAIVLLRIVVKYAHPAGEP
jgi:hypothetical protein